MKRSLVCVIFGHKFVYKEWGWSPHYCEFCLRCGKAHE